VLVLLALVGAVVVVRKGPGVLRRVTAAVDPGGVLGAWWVPWLVVALALVAAVVAVARFVVTRRTLSTRCCLVVLPTETFDPGDQAVRLFSRQLPGVPRLVRGWLDPRAGAVRVGLAAAGQGRMVYRWSAPRRSRSALQAAAGAYDEIELRPEDTITASASTVAAAPPGLDGDDDAPTPTRERDRGDSADELDLDEAEALGELLELSPFWAGDPRDPDLDGAP